LYEVLKICICQIENIYENLLAGESQSILMKTAGLLLLFSGWLLVLATLAMLGGGGARNAFVAAGLLVELLGLALVCRAHLPTRLVSTLRSDRG
jgi:hypothetical protein